MKFEIHALCFQKRGINISDVDFYTYNLIGFMFLGVKVQKFFLPSTTVVFARKLDTEHFSSVAIVKQS